MEDAPSTCSQNNEAIEAQHQCKLKKEELMREKSLAKATNEMVTAIYFHMMRLSAACITDRKVVTKYLSMHRRKELSDAAMYEILKDNIMMHTKGCGLDKDCKPDFYIAWSSQGVKTTIEELANHLRWIISEEKKKPQYLPNLKSICHRNQTWLCLVLPLLM